MSKEIRIAVVGVGNCAKSLIEGVQYYQELRTGEQAAGLAFTDIGGYLPRHLKFVAAWDIDKRKVWRPLAEAIYAAPNCAMDIIADRDVSNAVEFGAQVRQGPMEDGVADYMLDYPESVSFRPLEDQTNCDTHRDVVRHLREKKVDVILNYLPVGSRAASKFYFEAALEAGCHMVNCIPVFISGEEGKYWEQRFIDAGLTIVGSDMKSAFGASRLSQIVQEALLDAGIDVTQHIQLNMACMASQGDTRPIGHTANTDFLNMSQQYRLKEKHISKENVIRGQNKIRGADMDNRTLFAGPSLTVQAIGDNPTGTDTKVCNLDIVAHGFAGARYYLTARLEVQDSPNSAGVVIDAVRFCKVASELGIVGFLRGPSAYTQKTPPVQLTAEQSLEECRALAERRVTKYTEPQLKENFPKAADLDHGFNDSDQD
jgi:myo-inositol-1-phosphate synthase